MLAKEAIAQAKTLVQDFYADEQVSGVRLEEVEFDERSDSWLITLGILRPTFEGKAKSIGDTLNGAPLRRTYLQARQDSQQRLEHAFDEDPRPTGR